MAQTKKKGSSASSKKASSKANNKQRRYIASIVLFASALLLLAMAIVKGERVWTGLHSFVLGVFGWNAYLVPFLMGYIAVLLATEREGKSIAARTTVIGGFMLIAAALVDVFSKHPADETFWKHLANAYTTGSTGTLSGGFLGALPGGALYTAFGDLAAKITIIILAFVFVMIFTGTTLLSLFKAIQTPAKHIRDAAEEAYERKVERDAERKAKAAEKVEVGVTPGRHPFDVPVEGEPNPVVEPADPQDLAKKGKKVVDSFNGKSKIDIDVTDAGEDVAIEPPVQEEAPIVSPDILDALTGEITVVADESNKDEPTTTIEEEVENFDFDVEQGSDVAAEPIEYRYPPLELLDKPSDENYADIRAEMTATAEKLVNTLLSFGVETRLVNISRGPSVTRYELQPAAGVRISKIANLTDDIALSLATAGVRIEAPIPNKAAVGIEVPNKAKSSVALRSLIEANTFSDAKSLVTGVLGKSITGEDCYMDIAKMPHLLIAGTTGSGKSVCLNSLILSILYKAKPDEVKLIMIDPKAVEMKVYNGIPHLLVPVVNDPRKAAGALGWAVSEMLRRYQLLSEYDVRNLEGYNELAEKDDSMQKLPQIVIFIDELADLMMAAPKEVEDYICRLAQMARAAGMHLVIATQSPRADIITGLIKANIPSRISLKVSSPLESRIILDMQGAERLIGYGDMLYSPSGTSKPTRIQGCWVSDREIKAVADFIKQSANGNYDDAVMQEIERQASLASQKKKSDADEGESGGEADEMLPKAIECVVEAGQASTSLLQRKLKLGYARAARIMDQLEERKIIGPFEGAKPRSVLLTHQQFLEMQASGEIE